MFAGQHVRAFDCDWDPPRPDNVGRMPEQRAPEDIRLIPDAATDARCSERYVWHLLGRGDLTRYKAAGRTYVDVGRLRDLLVPRPV